jgi:hypothetical protein
MNTRPKSNKKTGRNYSRDKLYEESPQQVRNREERNLARKHALQSVAKTHNIPISKAKAMKKGQDVDHIKSLKDGGSNKKSNTRWRSIHSNRGDKTY